jgi:signal transduction histidine kinase
VETRTDADEAVLQVHNAGEPIPAEALARIFEPLERGVEPPDVERRSIGLGLFIVDQIVRAHGGRIEVRSEAGGTTFTVRLPRA